MQGNLMKACESSPPVDLKICRDEADHHLDYIMLMMIKINGDDDERYGR